MLTVEQLIDRSTYSSHTIGPKGDHLLVVFLRYISFLAFNSPIYTEIKASSQIVTMFYLTMCQLTSQSIPISPPIHLIAPSISDSTSAAQTTVCLFESSERKSSALGVIGMWCHPYSCVVWGRVSEVKSEAKCI